MRLFHLLAAMINILDVMILFKITQQITIKRLPFNHESSDGMNWLVHRFSEFKHDFSWKIHGYDPCPSRLSEEPLAVPHIYQATGAGMDAKHYWFWKSWTEVQEAEKHRKPPIFWSTLAAHIAKHFDFVLNGLGDLGAALSEYVFRVPFFLLCRKHAGYDFQPKPQRSRVALAVDEH